MKKQWSTLLGMLHFNQSGSVYYFQNLNFMPMT
jgi:hypothetical protein